MDNYIPDQNRFHLSGPPEWWLKQLKDFDASLVVVPSRQGFYYRLAQRRKLNLPIKMVNDLMKEQADTQMLASLGLIPVTTISATATWSPLMFAELEARAPWRQGGAQKFIEKLDAFEADKEARREAKIDDQLTQRSREGYRYYKSLTGQRTFVNSAKRMEPKKSASTAGYTQTGSGLFVPNF